MMLVEDENHAKFLPKCEAVDAHQGTSGSNQIAILFLRMEEVASMFPRDGYRNKFRGLFMLDMKAVELAHFAVPPK
jgi:hypothetical protein